jgi:hypothetical protein
VDDATRVIGIVQIYDARPRRFDGASPA